MKSRYPLALCAILAPVIAVLAIGPAGATPEDILSKQEADGIIFERQNIMLQLEKDAELLGEMAAGLKPAEKLAEVTQSIADSASASKAAFVPHVPGGRSKPDVWANWADYSTRLDEFDLSAKKLAELGAKGDLIGVTNVLGSALPCKECHDVYRGPKKAS